MIKFSNWTTTKKLIPIPCSVSYKPGKSPTWGLHRNQIKNLISFSNLATQNTHISIFLLICFLLKFQGWWHVPASRRGKHFSPQNELDFSPWSYPSVLSWPDLEVKKKVRGHLWNTLYDMFSSTPERKIPKSRNNLILILKTYFLLLYHWFVKPILAQKPPHESIFFFSTFQSFQTPTAQWVRQLPTRIPHFSSTLERITPRKVNFISGKHLFSSSSKE